MKKSDFYYELPQELIAQEPIEPRDHSRMLVLDRKTGKMQDSHFYNLVDYLNPGDCLILNDSRVLPARLYGVRKDTGSVVEILLLNPKGKNRWEVLAGPGKKAKPGKRLVFGEGLMEAEVLDILDEGNRLLEFYFDESQGTFYNFLERIGEMPLPHYITKRLENTERYQTVYSRQPGSAAAPTAGLHFTPELLSNIRDKGVGIGFVTLHV
ncbi:MAG TPA: S-adenosylmethionine:tRNA ribosyltransferase-isomerase, partial [Candidatus Avimonas sp.]|nr:S-adenosylmethionine:tRNA ribosyltransferase-isomerase [Candidatus Avimonas sp.]